MVLIVAAVALAACPMPPQGGDAPQNPPRASSENTDTTPPQRPDDVILMRDGETITGEILKQSGNYIEVRIGTDTVVGFERSRIKSIRRGVGAKAPAPAARLAARDEWFLLHDAAGASVGHLHGLVQPDQDGSIRLTEEWFFSGSKGFTRVTTLEVVDAELQPRSCFYHERVHDTHGRLTVERLSNGEVNGSELVVEERSLQSRARRRYPFAPSCRFPILFREELRQREAVEVHAAQRQVFDPKTGQLRDFSATSIQRRQVEYERRPIQVRELTIIDGDQANAEWIDANAQVLRREINGAALVAIRVTKARALRAEVNTVNAGVDPAIAASASGRVAMWIPNPIWRVQVADNDRVTIAAPLYGATATLIEMDQLPANLHLESAADAVLRWVRLSIGKGLEVRQRSASQIRRHAAIRLDLMWTVDAPGESQPYRGTCHVLKVGERFVALFCAMPRDNAKQLQGDVARIVQSIQLEAQDIAPVLQGPLATPVR